MNGYNMICGAIHAASGKFADYWDFAHWIRPRFEDLPYDQASIQAQLVKELEQMLAPQKTYNQHSALKRLIGRDLERAATEIDTLPTKSGFDKHLHKAYTLTIQALRDLGLDFPEPSYFVVNQFPEPYNKMDWVAFAPDKADQEDFGIQTGVYLLESELASFYSELVLAHELVHVIIGTVNPRLLGRGLEEGIAEIIGTLYVGSHLHSPRIARNIFVHTRLGTNASQSNKLYLDYTRQAAIIYRRFGLRGIAQLMHEGRDKIKEVEEHCLSGNIDAVSLEKGIWNDTLTKLLDEVLLGFIPNLAVSPFAAYISGLVKVGQTVGEIAEAARSDINTTKEALEELQSRTFTMLLDKDKIAYSDLSFITRTKSLRYEIKL